MIFKLKQFDSSNTAQTCDATTHRPTATNARANNTVVMDKKRLVKETPSIESFYHFACVVLKKALAEADS